MQRRPAKRNARAAPMRRASYAFELSLRPPPEIRHPLRFGNPFPFKPFRPPRQHENILSSICLSVQICEYAVGVRIRLSTFDTMLSKLNRVEPVSFFHSGAEKNAFHFASRSERLGNPSI